MEMETCTILLHKNAAFLWFILVPETDESDFLDLDPVRQTELLDVCNKLNTYIKSKSFIKTNFASIGNVVSQMHLHVIGRSPDDPLWPQVVWGNTATQSPYTSEEVELIRQAIKKICLQSFS
jgi:diadenosine tetraphosphate (Ap4A) HIT family hydrolase